jgi:hypothetical protein
MILETGNPGGTKNYFRLVLAPTRNHITVVWMNQFSEPSYHKGSFVQNQDGEAYYFDSEEDAVKQLNEWFTEKEIDPKYYLKHEINLIR